MNYPLQLSRGLTTSFLQEVEKRNNRILNRINDNNKKIKSGKLSFKSYLKNMETLFSRMPVHACGRNDNRRLYAFYLSKANHNPAGKWDEDSFLVEKIELGNMGEDRRVDIVVSRHAIERIFERSPKSCIDSNGKPDIFRIYEFIYDLPVWKEYVFFLTLNLVSLNSDDGHFGDKSKVVLESLNNMKFMIPCKDGVFVCIIHRGAILIRTYLSEDMLTDYQKDLNDSLKLIPNNFKVSRLAFHSSFIRNSHHDHTFDSDAIRINVVAAYLANCVLYYPDFFFQDTQDSVRNSLLFALRKFSQDFKMTRLEITDFFNSVSGLDDKKVTTFLKRVKKEADDQ